MKRAIIVCICVFVALAAFAQKYNLTRDQIEFLQELVDENYLILKPELNQAYIDTDLWRGMDINIKNDFGAVLAIYCTNQKGTDIYWVEIFDMYSGRKLAKWSETWGLKIK